MTVIVEATSLDDVRRAKPTMIYYSANTCWWTHRSCDVRQIPKGESGEGLPCDPRGGVLFQADDPEQFLRIAEGNPEAYGRHGLAAFVASHNDNCLVSDSDRRPTCLRTWDEYNSLLDSVEGR